MKSVSTNCIVLLLVVVLHYTGFSQEVPLKYMDLIEKAESSFARQDYANAHLYYSNAFASNGDIGYASDRYNAARAWSLDANADSAFFQLQRIATKGNYSDLFTIMSDTAFVSLHADARWKILLDRIKLNLASQ